jgi:RNA polymerase sigma-70 factor, ECF subfamily
MYVTDHVRSRHPGPPLNIAPRAASHTSDCMTDAATAHLAQADDPSDHELIASWKAGDQRAAARLVERHATAVARFVASVGERVDVDDVVQETFGRAFASLDSFRGESSFRTWLFTIARRLVLDRRRSERRRGGGSRMQSEVQDGDAVTEFDALDAVVADETERRMREAVARLTPTQREVFTLRVAEGLSYREIAEAVDTTEGAARVHYHNAMRAVKEFLDE